MGRWTRGRARRSAKRSDVHRLVSRAHAQPALLSANAIYCVAWRSWRRHAQYIGCLRSRSRMCARVHRSLTPVPSEPCPSICDASRAESAPSLLQARTAAHGHAARPQPAVTCPVGGASICTASPPILPLDVLENRISRGSGRLPRLLRPGPRVTDGTKSLEIESSLPRHARTRNPRNRLCTR